MARLVQMVFRVYQTFEEVCLKNRQCSDMFICDSQAYLCLANEMTLAKVGRRGSLVLPAEERRKAEISEGDRVEVVAREAGLLYVRKVKSLREIQKRMAGRLPQWRELEGKADEMVEREATSH